MQFYTGDKRGAEKPGVSTVEYKTPDSSLQIADADAVVEQRHMSWQEVKKEWIPHRDDSKICAELKKCINAAPTEVKTIVTNALEWHHPCLLVEEGKWKVLGPSHMANR